MTNLKTISLSLLTLLFALGFGCTSRIEIPVTDENSTLIYLPKKVNDISAKIIFCRKTDKKTGDPIGAGSAFTIMEDGRVQAIVDIENRFAKGNRELMFHLDWIDPHGKSIYLKRIIRLPDDSSSVLKSSISIVPETREPGEYTLQVYYFRELIAEKKFELLPKFQISDYAEKEFFSQLVFCSKVDKKSGERIGVDSIFTIGEKEKVRAYFDLINHSEFGNRELLFHFDWIGLNDSSFYKKQIDLASDDTSYTIASAITISPEKRQPGEYALRLYLFNELITEKNFELIPEPKVIPLQVKASIILYRKLDKKTGERIDEGTVFTLKNKRKVRAFVNFESLSNVGEQGLEFRLEWIGPDGKSFYEKKIVLAPGDLTSAINSSISISPDKRQAGEYSLRLFLFNDLIAEKKFELHPES